MRFRDIPQISHANYEVDVSWKYLEKWLDDDFKGEDSYNLDPDYQREHVWTEDQQIAYVEYKLKGGRSGSNIYWNCKGFSDEQYVRELVDGKQRITAVRKFLNNELPVFGNIYYKDFEDELKHLTGETRFKMCVNDLQTRKEVLQWYLDLNSGVAHTNEELAKVKQLMEKETYK